jgi:hypothetical protein
MMHPAAGKAKAKHSNGALREQICDNEPCATATPETLGPAGKTVREEMSHPKRIGCYSVRIARRFGFVYVIGRLGSKTEILA